MDVISTRPPILLRLYLFVADRWLSRVWAHHLEKRRHKGKESESSVAQKMGQQPFQRQDNAPLIWGHAVGLGESQALIGLFQVLADQLPAHQFLITFSTQSAFQSATRMGLPARCQWRFAPIDVPHVVDAFLTQAQPCLMICCELDLWPAMLTRTAKRKIPMVLVNARLQKPGWKKNFLFAASYRYLLNLFTRIYSQNNHSAQLLESLGTESHRLKVSGTIKALSPSLPCDTQVLAQFESALKGRWVWLLASSHAGEEAIAIQAHQMLKTNSGVTPLLIIAPRFPDRANEVAALCPADTPRRGRSEFPSQAAFYIADSFGEMGLWYRLANTALIGGSLVPVGGHNPFEPARLGCFCLYGPKVWNFEESYAQLTASGYARRVDSLEDLYQALQDRLSSGTQSSDRMALDMSALTSMMTDLAYLARK